MKRYILLIMLTTAIPTSASYAKSDNIDRHFSTKTTLAQCVGWWTHCWGNLPDGSQVVAPDATNETACHSAIKKCANGVEITAYFNSYPVVQPCNIAVHFCPVED
jgi:hypothetical protein